MALTYGDITTKVQQLVEDTTNVTAPALLRSAVIAALDAILPWVPKLAVDTLTAGATAYTLPDDFVSVEAVVNESGVVLPKARLMVGDAIIDVSENAWLLYPSGSITFSNELDEDYKLYYLAHWTYPTEGAEEDEALDAPVTVQNGLVYYATAYLILPDAISIAEIRQYGTRVDSGNPEHNPRQRAVDFLLNHFRSEMNNMINKYQRIG